jgi:hypothetical protein
MSILFAAALMATLAAGLLGGRDHYTSPRSNDFTLRTCLMSPVIKKKKKKKKKGKEKEMEQVASVQRLARFFKELGPA